MMVTSCPSAAAVGVNEVIVGGGMKVNPPATVAVPPGVVTTTSPEAPPATSASIVVGEMTVNDAAAVPPKLTTVAPEKLVPNIEMTAPVPPLEGVIEEMVGAGLKINPAIVAVPPG